MKNKFYYSFLVFSFFSLVNITFFFLIKNINGLGFEDSKFYEIFILPACYCLSLFLFIVVFSKEKAYLFFPVFIALLKLALILPQYGSMASGDFLLTTSTNFSQLFNTAEFLLERSGLQSNITELLLHVIVMFIYQMLIIVLTKNIYQKLQKQIAV